MNKQRMKLSPFSLLTVYFLLNNAPFAYSIDLLALAGFCITGGSGIFTLYTKHVYEKSLGRLIERDSFLRDYADVNRDVITILQKIKRNQSLMDSNPAIGDSCLIPSWVSENIEQFNPQFSALTNHDPVTGITTRSYNHCGATAFVWMMQFKSDHSMLRQWLNQDNPSIDSISTTRLINDRNHHHLDEIFINHLKNPANEEAGKENVQNLEKLFSLPALQHYIFNKLVGKKHHSEKELDQHEASRALLKLGIGLGVTCIAGTLTAARICYKNS